MTEGLSARPFLTLRTAHACASPMKHTVLRDDGDDDGTPTESIPLFYQP